MHAIRYTRYGTPDVLRLDEVPTPEPKAGEVLVRVQAAGVDPGVWHLVTGTPYAVRAAFGMRRPRRPQLGGDVAGVVDRVGEGVTAWSPGDAVFGVAVGSFAEYAIARADRLVRRPSALTAEHAAALPTSGLTAMQGLRLGGADAGRRVIVLGAGGGVGHFAVQLARIAGAHVTAVCGPDKVDFVRELGADVVVDYTRERPSGTFDTVIEIAGNRSVSELRALTAPGGTVVLAGGEGGGPLLGAAVRQLRVSLTPWVRPRVRPLLSVPNAADLERLAELAGSGELRPHVERVFPLDGAADALRDLERGHTRGKLVLRVAD
ncbi:NADPH:quinone reductase-like Zn-dependent oxidoreductase [Diaminobutyricimonas aerilata]|uniref:NADPH:quinone reductase-like Zn-dependent oxidoreductase n=1 Tax=Diaminobutyricimonas aerilata TaxID=1162967 RepID=A0A2M9CG49_9MICO|nr:NAD(P)-dependent alcohol dehydrogenase [Diaminobutyricimonas aerilata]PJJ70825.1 NADPH:quinone reductase-like Zn-dependent oxidoreductase [Diaminobutyricimonas aerilata]